MDTTVAPEKENLRNRRIEKYTVSEYDPFGGPCLQFQDISFQKIANEAVNHTNKLRKSSKVFHEWEIGYRRKI